MLISSLYFLRIVKFNFLSAVAVTFRIVTLNNYNTLKGLLSRKVSITFVLLKPDSNEKESKSKSRHRQQLLSGSIDQIDKDLQEIKKTGVDHAILNFNRSTISSNIDNMIDVSKQLSGFIR
jgi:hypothetical protein